MKKLLLLLTVGLVAGGANAQQSRNVSIVRTGVTGQADRSVADARIDAANKQIAAYKAAHSLAPATSAAKTTALPPRVYNWSDYLKNIKTMTNSSPYMWFDGMGMGIYSNGSGGLELDTIALCSYGIAIAPWSNEFNDAGVPAYNGQFALTQGTSYTVDSLVTYGFYGRNSTKPNVVDTMIFALAYGPGGASSSVERVYYSGAGTAANFGVDTLQCTDLIYDTVTHTAGKAASGAAVTIVKIALTIADSSTSRVAAKFGVSIPAGNYVGATVTFKTGDPSYVPYTDTIFAGSANATTPFKFGMWRPAYYEETTAQFPSYTKGNYNTSQIKFLPNSSTNGYQFSYIPGWAFTDPAFNLEWPDIDFVVSSTSTFVVGIQNTNSIIAGVNVYPNPSTTEVSVKFNLNSAANTTVSVKNMVGQVIATQNMGTVANGVATFSTANLTNGIYFCTVESNGQQTTNRFVVAH